MQIGLGTVQFGLDYGVSNTAGNVPLEQVKQILEFCYKNQIQLLDTASIYGNSEQVLGRTVDHQQVNIVSKIYPNLDYSKGLYKTEVNNSLQRLNGQCLYGLLLHNGNELLMPDGEQKFAELQHLKSEGLTNKVGVSVYDPGTLFQIIEQYDIDLVQIPLNLFDQRFVTSGLLAKLKQKNIEVHSRSTFLQGLLLMQENDLPEYFQPYQQHILNYFAQRGENKLVAPIQFIKQLELVDVMVVGCTNVNELAQILDAFSQQSSHQTHLNFEQFQSDEPNLILPTHWKLN